MVAVIVCCAMISSSTSGGQASSATATGIGDGLQFNIKIDTKREILLSISMQLEISLRWPKQIKLG